MRKVFSMFFVALFLMLALDGCKKKNPEEEQLQRYVEHVNSQPNKVLHNGLILLSCKYENGDSVITYHLKVADNRFDGTSPDSIKSNFLNDLSLGNTSQRKLVKLFIKHAISVKYVLDFDDKVLEILIPISELSANNK